MFVIGYPKSGNTWLCYLLAYCLNSEYDDIDEPGVHPRDEYQRKYVKGGFAHPSYQDKVGKILKTHNISGEDISKPLVYIVRDGRDVLVSYYFFKKSFLKENTPAFHDFVKFYSKEWANHVKKYLELENIIPVKYEELSDSPKNVLENVFSKLNLKVVGNIINESINLFSFNKLANRKRGCEDRASFFRKGIVGDWKNHFSKQDIRVFNNNTREVLKLLEY